MSFTISQKPIDTADLNRALADPEAGALVTFEGWVRNHNEGHAVEALEYECYETLAVKEGQKILDEAKQKFSTLEIRCIHRSGKLKIGEVAVWVGAIAKHRGDAFDATEYVIDQVKIRVPIWKKEYYKNGDSGWVNCHECAKHVHTHP
jgi:molybdopterin synthase catalytic subunit